MKVFFKSLKSDPCVFIYSEGSIIDILAMYVGDISLLGKYLKVLGMIKQKVVDRFSIIDMGDMS